MSVLSDIQTALSGLDLPIETGVFSDTAKAQFCLFLTKRPRVKIFLYNWLRIL